MARQTDVYGLLTLTTSIPVGITLGVLFTGIERQVGVVVEQISGGNLYMIGATAGQTLSASELASAFSGGTNFFLIQTGKSVNIDGSPRFYLACTGSTANIQMLNGQGSGY